MTSNMTTSLSPAPATPTPWAESVEAVLSSLETDPALGLTSAEAAPGWHNTAPTSIPEPDPDPLWKRYWGQLTGDAVVRLLLIGGIVSLLLGDYLEGTAIIIMLNIMAGFGLWQEGKATDAARSLRNADNPLKLVVRDGVRNELPVDQIVPGDIVYLPTGAIAPADGRVIASVNAEKDSSKLTGESLPVELAVDPARVDNGHQLAEEHGPSRRRHRLRQRHDGRHRDRRLDRGRQDRRPPGRVRGHPHAAGGAARQPGRRDGEDLPLDRRRS